MDADFYYDFVSGGVLCFRNRLVYGSVCENSRSSGTDIGSWLVCFSVYSSRFNKDGNGAVSWKTGEKKYESFAVVLHQ